MARKLWTTLAIGFGLAAAAVLALGLAASIQYLRDDHPIVFPVPRGPHPVGRLLMDWTDRARNRELMVFLWYPAQSGAYGKRCEYIPGKWGELEARHLFPIPARRLRQIEVSAIEGAAPASGTIPILIFLPGMGRIPAQYTVLAEDLASFGYLVAGATPTGFSRPVVFSDGRIVEGREDWNLENPAEAQRLIRIWAADAGYALDRLALDPRFAGRIRSRPAAIFGHSFGGAVAVHALYLDPRFTRAANLDGGFFGGPIPSLNQPLLILQGAATIDPPWTAVCKSDRAVCAAVPFPRARHMNFSDAGILPSRFPFPRSMLMLGDIDGLEFLHNLSDRLRSFFE